MAPGQGLPRPELWLPSGQEWVIYSPGQERVLTSSQNIHFPFLPFQKFFRCAEAQK